MFVVVRDLAFGREIMLPTTGTPGGMHVAGVTRERALVVMATMEIADITTEEKGALTSECHRAIPGMEEAEMETDHGDLTEVMTDPGDLTEVVTEDGDLTGVEAEVEMDTEIPTRATVPVTNTARHQASGVLLNMLQM